MLHQGCPQRSDECRVAVNLQVALVGSDVEASTEEDNGASSTARVARRPQLGQPPLALPRFGIEPYHDVKGPSDVGRRQSALVEQFGMGSDDAGVRQYTSQDSRNDAPLSDGARQILEAEIRLILDQERQRAHEIVKGHSSELTTLRDALLKEKVLDAGYLEHHLNKGSS